MKVRQQVDGRPVEVEFELEGREVQFRILHDGQPPSAFAKASVIEAEPGVFSVIAGTRSYDFRLEHSHYGVVAQHRSMRVLLEPLRRMSPTGRGQSGGPAAIKAAMPGRVVRVLVAEGDTVEEGQGMVVLEAMKMQNEIRAPRSGVVRRLSATEGATVAAGALLCHLE